mmetsp:Transcript_77286/g.151625  ORF Transcript_77286/g.151625 Transcript_77286/m.151625 type:complete len:93 (+) Transcript_77286:67-345(+)|eukprot:CAMPEP_0170399164 /NCGR_PEP_ID=MMETSP0117_2-20130122/23813_1 /TAXON_ID=400756 /ORGANISM="Durinskia baltica, Strain CSIRO CS-38" /LENGTH=92 /DNA_ID=CAMNT_0010655817 /DNA_START=60 /DNA_END=338 /DNA_ORIENTATION=+
MARPNSAAAMLLSCLAALVSSLAAAQRPVPLAKELAWAEGTGTPLMVTPNIMTGILVGIVWLMLFLTGFCCLFNVQTPQSYEEKCLVLNKQY